MNMNRCMEIADWKGFAARREDAERRGRLRGIGLANYIETPAGVPIERARVTVRTDADQIDVVIGTQSSGQGHETSFAQVIESWLGVPAKGGEAGSRPDQRSSEHRACCYGSIRTACHGIHSSRIWLRR